MVERAGLENRNTRKRIVGSNPTLSANQSTALVIFLPELEKVAKCQKL